MPEKTPPDLTRRERQIMDIIYESREATAANVREQMPDAPSYSTVRALLRLLEEKGHLEHRQDGPRYVFFPTRPRAQAAEGALGRVVKTFFGGSVEDTVAALLDTKSQKLSSDELERLASMIDRARKEGQ